ncbi:pyridoxal kinase PdxY [Larsenimonas salina]|uniref:pyridoxal kinase PdxY n=1 Tax=Larsenimonas salina TaxID=1295565 RepID=UPI002073038A|nr:pyridoxal kinase PdxY [Larsenimonas salina]MCM5705646.1 pyridoxal kinase PdxY [Larsenimonas salina]
MPHLLSIQSHVAFGHVGNRAAVFPLQRLGFDVSALHTVQFSNHTGYGHFSGTVFSPDHLLEVLNGMETLGALSNMTALLSGYLGDEHTGDVVLTALERIRRHHPDAIYCCDPVMGDVGRGFFVKDGLPDWIREHAIPRATITTPNQFELGFLTGTTIATRQDALEATRALRARGPAEVVVTSLDIDELPEGHIAMMVDTAEGSWELATPRLHFETPPNGAGDLTSALYLAHRMNALAPEDALARTAASVYDVFSATFASGERELQLIAAQDSLVTPSHPFAPRRVR